MNFLSDIIIYIRRLLKTPSTAIITDQLIIDYINRFWIMDVDARMQLFDLKTTYQFQCTPGIDQYNMPLYNIQSETQGVPGSPDIGWYPMYQGFFVPTKVNGIDVDFNVQRQEFFKVWPNYVQDLVQAETGNGGNEYTINLPFFPSIPGHVDMTGIMANNVANNVNMDPIIGTTLSTVVPFTSTFPNVYFVATGENGQNIVVSDSGQFLSGDTGGQLYGLLMLPGGSTGIGNTPLSGGYSTTVNTVNYQTGVANVTFPTNIPNGTPINAQCIFIEQGLPRAMLYYNNVITLRSPPDKQYLVELGCYLSPAAFFNTGAAIPFAYMAEYIARGTARKIMADTGDWEQFAAYEPLFTEQEHLVWKRSQRQFTSCRTQTIYSSNTFQNNYNQSSLGT